MLIRELVEQEVDEALSPKVRRLAQAGLLGGTLALGGVGQDPVNNTAPKSELSTELQRPSYEVHRGEVPKPKVPKPEPKPEIEEPESEERPLTREDYKRIKREFISELLPIIRDNNESIQAIHGKAKEILGKDDRSAQEQAYIDRLMKQYRVGSGDGETLLARIQPIPPSLALAQAAVESGWGTSRLARIGNVLFGQKGYGDNVVSAAEDGTTYSAFDSYADAVESYMRNLNSHPAYKKMRAYRYYMQRNGREPTSYDLIQHMDKYSTRGDHYIRQISSIIRNNGLTRFDGSDS